MDLLRRALRRYRNDGLRNVIKGIWLLIFWGPKSHLIKHILGKRLHQQLGNYPNVGYWPNISKPSTFNEKVMHRKLFTNRELFTTVSDKYHVRDYIRETIDEEILNEVYVVSEDPELITFSEMPSEFVLKATHASGMTKVVDDKSNTDIDEVVDLCHQWLSDEVGDTLEEYWYSEITPRIIVERRLHDRQYDIPLDYKLFVYHGKVKYIQVDFDRFSGHTRRFFDRRWNPMELRLTYPLGPDIKKPEQFGKMINIAETIGADFDFVRVDLYQPDGEFVVFGEITIAPGSGAERFDPIEYDHEFGSHWKL